MSSSNPATLDYRPAAPDCAGEDGPSEVAATLAGRLAGEMRQRWRRGEQPRAEEFLVRHPELREEVTSALEVIYEEVLLRQEKGEPDVWTDILARFPHWQEQLQALQDCHQVLDGPRLVPQFPAVGEVLGEFRLLAELGRGAHGRVFLAAQAGLGGRPVVLKVTPRAGQEHLSLARLQHTNIVPLYAAREDRTRHLRMLCMPYFGGATLSEVLRMLASLPLNERTGRDLVQAVDHLQASRPAPALGTSGPRRFLVKSTYVQAVCWIGACCAEALQYAHERGLLHLDLKPSNLLIAADGQPMLLDFHLAHTPLHPDGPLPDRLGGTPAYMAPEQREAAEAVGAGTVSLAPVEARADVYSLGVLLYEALGGELPYRPGHSPRLDMVTPAASVGLADIIARCLATRPPDRYADAAALANDLRRHIADRPLTGVRNRSLTERWRKWRRRQPSALRFLLILFVTLAAIAGLAAGTWIHFSEKFGDAERALAEGKKQWRQYQHFEDAEATLQHGLSLVQALPFCGELRERLYDELKEAAAERAATERGRLARDLHNLAGQLRILFAMDLPPSRQRDSLYARCRELWEKRSLIRELLAPGEAAGVVDDLTELALLWTDLQVRSAGPTDSPAARRQALQVLSEAREFSGQSVVLEYEEAQHRRALGLPPRLQGSSPQPRRPWEHYALGRACLRAGDLERAAHELESALRQEPQNCWVNYYYGLCAFRLGRQGDAVQAFSVCVGAAPDLAGVYYNRALALAALGRTEPACRDYDRALELDSTLAAAALNRGMLRFQEKKFVEATRDLERALRLGAPASTVHYDLALVELARQQPNQAVAHLHAALEHVPEHRQARQLLDELEFRGRK